MSRFFRKTNASEIVKKLVVKTVCERSLINEGDRILIAVSGGKIPACCLGRFRK